MYLATKFGYAAILVLIGAASIRADEGQPTPGIPIDNQLVLTKCGGCHKADANGMDEEKPVYVFLTGANEWWAEDDWPLPGTQEVPFYLHSRGKANSVTGDGGLSMEAPSAEAWFRRRGNRILGMPSRREVAPCWGRPATERC